MSFPLTHAVLPANKIRSFETKTNVAKAVIEQSLKEAVQKASKKVADKYKVFMSTPKKNRRVMLSNLNRDEVKFTNNNTTMRIDKRYFENLVNKNMRNRF